jgi:hypothetical protein
LCNDVATDNADGVYVTGYFSGKPEFELGPGMDGYKTFEWNYDAFFIKYNAQGDYQWGKIWGNPEEWAMIRGRGVEINSSGNAYIVGSFAGTIDFDPGPDIDKPDNTDYYSSCIFISEFDLHGEYKSVMVWLGAALHTGSGPNTVWLDRSDNLYLTGGFANSMDLDPGPGVDEQNPGDGGAFVLKLDPYGTYLWGQSWGGLIHSESAWGNAVTSCGGDGLYVSGRFHGSTDFDPGPGEEIHECHDPESLGYGDAFLSKFDLDGNFLWARTWGARYTDAGYSLACDDSCNVYVAGEFDYWVDFDPGPEEKWQNAGEYGAIFLVKFPPDGNWQ